MALFEAEAPPRRPRKPRRARAIVSVVVGTVIIGAVGFGGVWLINNPQPIIDQVTVWQYEPPKVVAGHAARLGLTDHGRFLYYASTPEVRSAGSFAEACPADKSEDEGQFGILGCYQSGAKTIFLFDVTDTRLDGSEEVVAAHEMLHAAWDRMSSDERDRLSALLEKEVTRISDDPAFSARMDFYARTEPGQRANELHSIIGTEVPGISKELEEYYAQYFTDRDIVTGLYSSSHAVFVQLQEQSEQLVASMEELRVSTEADYASYSDGYAQLNKDIEQFNRRADDGYYTSQNSFDRSRNTLVQRRVELDDLFASITAREAQYNEMVTELTSLNALSEELQRGLNIGGAVDAGL